MAHKLLSTLSIMLLLGSAPMTGVSANSSNDFSALNLTGGIGFDSKQNWLQPFTVKKAEPYDEAKDPFLRKGTENVEESQISFFAIPVVVVGIVLIFFFFYRE
jgi:hypothetical protein